MTDAADRGSERAARLDELAADVVRCRACPRLVDWREHVAANRRAAFAAEDYWARPVPGFGDPDAWLLIVGLAPGAHGSNRTGRMFTGDRSGVFLYRALHRAGLASRAEAIACDDGLALAGAFITAVVRCAPPGNKPTTDEWEHCRPFLERELDVLARVHVIVALGQYAYDRVLRTLRDCDMAVPAPVPRFGHGVEVPIRGPVAGAGNGTARGLTVLASYHPSQQNTFTGKLTEAMFDRIWARAVALRDA